jgi:hypothetical protein
MSNTFILLKFSYDNQNQFNQDLDNFANEVEKLGRFKYLCTTDQGISEIGMWKKMQEVVGSWFGKEDKTSKDNLRIALSKIIYQNKNFIHDNPDHLENIHKIAESVNLIKKVKIKAEVNVESKTIQNCEIAKQIKIASQTAADVRTIPSIQTKKIIVVPPIDLSKISEEHKTREYKAKVEVDKPATVVPNEVVENSGKEKIREEEVQEEDLAKLYDAVIAISEEKRERDWYDTLMKTAEIALIIGLGVAFYTTDSDAFQVLFGPRWTLQPKD